jgi:endonuclease YncB( thermonuclease family)
MTTGMLQIHGTIDLAQIWPTGRSDADTTKVLLSVGANAVEFRAHASLPFKTTHVLDNAVSKGRARTPVLKKGQFTIRLQGIDAPELHYQPAALSPAEKKGLSSSQLDAFHNADHSYRQVLGASSSKALHDFLATSGKTTIDCRVFTQVDKPDEVFDTYGRFIGDIEVTIAGKKLNVNHWLVEQGWAYPTFYSSMTNDEIDAILALSKTARAKRAPVWKMLSKTIGPFDFTLLEPKRNDLSVIPTDKGAVLFPKLYRRYTNWSARNKAKTTNQRFQQYLASGTNGKPDACFETADFLSNGVHSATPRFFDEFVTAGKTVNFTPDGLVFKEAPSKLVDANGAPIPHF